MAKKMKQLAWKRMELDGAIFNENGAEGLVGIEECTDYELEDLTREPILKRKSSEISKLPKKTQKTKVIVESAKTLFTPSKEGGTSVMVDEINDILAWSSFDLPQSLLKGISALRFSEPTQIQSLTLPAAILGRRDILGAAETGSGKTLAFGLPILAGILKEKSKLVQSDQVESESDEELQQLSDNELGCVKAVKGVQQAGGKPLYALILTPTRELAMQVRDHLVAVAKFTDIRTAVVVGGLAAVKQERILSKGPEIVVATPGRLWELIQQGNPHLSQINNIKFLVIDETDRMLEKGHFEELHDLLERLNQDETKKRQRQNFVFSATLTMVHELPKYLTNKVKRAKLHGMKPEEKLQKIVNLLGISNPKVVDITSGTGTSATLTECRLNCSIKEKDYYIYYFLQKHPGRTLIFCNSIGCVRRLANLLGLLGCHPLPLHASMQQRQRLKNLEKFRDNDKGILVATDVAARGLDIPCVEHVLHYQTPRTSESYVHRSGRTARASRQGITVLLMEPSEIPKYVKLCRTLNKNEDLPIFPVEGSYLNAVKRRVNLARELDKLDLEVRKANSEEGWLQKAAQEMDIIVDEFSKKYDTDEARSFKKIAEIKRKQLALLLAKPIFPEGFRGKYPLHLTGSFSLAEKTSERAVDVLKTSMEVFVKEKRKAVSLYKPNKNRTEGNSKTGVGKPMKKSNKMQNKDRKKR